MLTFLDEKTCAIIDVLIANQNPLTVSELAQRAGISRRVVYYHLDKLNDLLKQENCLPIVNKQRMGLQLDSSQREYLAKLLQEEKISYILSTEERQLLLMFYIATTPKRITLETLMNVSETSRNTTLNDIAMIRDYLEESIHSIVLNVNKKYGYHFKCKGIAAIEFMYALLTQIFQSTNDMFTSLIKEWLSETNESYLLLSNQFKDSLYLAIQHVEQDLGKKFIEKDLHHMVEVFPYLILALKTIPNHQIETDLEEVFMKLEYRSAMKVLTMLSQQYGLFFSVSDVYVAALMLLSSRKYLDTHLNSNDYKKLSDDILDFIGEFETHSGVVFENKEDLRQRLLMHCKVLIYRKKYNVFTQNPLKASIKTKYKELFTFVKLCSYLLENRIGIRLSEDDIAYLTVHFGGALQQENKKMPIQRIAILTDEGVGIQRLLVEQCKKYMSRLEDIVLISRVEELAVLDNVDFVVTTMKRLDIKVPYITVNPIFQAQDIIHLLQISAGSVVSNPHEVMTKKLDVILVKYIPNTLQRMEANRAIQQFLNEQLALGYPVLEEKSHLLNYLTEEKMIVKEHVASIEEALNILSQPLLKKQTITSQYVDNILLDIQNKGMYMSIYPEVLLLHTHYIKDETQTDVSMLYTKQALQIGERSYQLIILLATEENMLHLPLIVTLDYLLQAHFMDKIPHQPTAHAMMQVIKKCLSEES